MATVKEMFKEIKDSTKQINHNTTRTADAMEEIAKNTKVLSENTIKIDNKITTIIKNNWRLIFALLTMLAGAIGLNRIFGG